MCTVHTDTGHIRSRKEQLHRYSRKDQVHTRSHNHRPAGYKRGMLPWTVLRQPDTDKLQVSSYLYWKYLHLQSPGSLCLPSVR